MAVRTLATSGTLSCIGFSGSPLSALGNSSATGAADMATIKSLIKDDLNPTSVSPNTFVDFNGLLMIPRRGLLRVFYGDVVAVDSTGWPILLSKASATGANWAVSPTFVATPIN